MNVEERLSEIERRLAALEAGSGAHRPAPPRLQTPDAVAARPPASTRTVPPELAPSSVPRPAAIISERWLGQRGLLAVGILLVLLAAGYLLKLAFDRGWISPVLRCTGGVVAGLASAGAGAFAIRKGLRRYGAGLIGLGFGIVYLSLWAASRLYELIPSGLDIGALTFVSLALAAVAYVLDFESLCVAAAAGAFFAPIFINAGGHPDGFLLYLTIIGATLGAAAASKRWRHATFLVAVCVFGLGLAASAEPAASPYRMLLLGALAGAGGLYTGMREGWGETRLLAFAGGWGLLLSAHRVFPSALVALGGTVLAAPVWARALRSTTIWPDPAGEHGGVGGWSAGEGLCFYLTPLCLAWVAAGFAPVWFNTHPGGAWLLVGIAYAIPGLGSPILPFTLATAGCWAIAALAQWPGLNAVFALLALSLWWAAADHLLHRADGRWYSLGTVTLGLIHLIARDLPLRGWDSPAFRDTWAAALWLAIATVAALAAGLWRRTPPTSPGVAAPSTSGMSLQQSWTIAREHWPARAPAGLWIAAGALLLFGVTGELIRFFRQSPLSRDTAHLAGGLSVSAWWTAFAAALVTLGFARNVRALRIAGLAVAGLAVAKVLLFDLSELDALYRVASVLILGLVSLLLAFLYHRHEAEA